MRARSAALLVVAVTGVLAAYMLVRAVDLFRTGQLKGILLGAGVVLLVAVGALLVAGEVRLGAGSERLAKRLAEEGGLPEAPDPADLMPSGRLSKEAADAAFERRRLEVEAAPEDWRAWWRLAAAYGDARDTPRGRRAMRKAVALERAERARG